MGALFLLALSLSSCRTQTDIVIARGHRLPDEVNGFAQVLQNDPVRIGVIGTDAASEQDIAGYAVVHVSDLEVMLQSVAELQAQHEQPQPVR